MANLDIIEREGLLDEAARLETTLHEKFAPLAEHPAVARGAQRTGCGRRRAAGGCSAPHWVGRELRAHGVATRAVGAGAVQVSPTFVMSDDQVDDLVAGFRGALAALS